LHAKFVDYQQNFNHRVWNSRINLLQESVWSFMNQNSLWEMSINISIQRQFSKQLFRCPLCNVLDVGGILLTKLCCCQTLCYSLCENCQMVLYKYNLHTRGTTVPKLTSIKWWK
jgi:hypothetical protein